MQEILQQVQNYIRMVWRYRWLALGVAMLVSLVGWVHVARLPPQYEVTTRVYLDTRTLLQPVLRGLAVDTAAYQNNVDLMRRTLLVRPNLEAVARQTDLDLQARTPAEFDALLNNLGRQIRVSSPGRGDQNIFVISYQHHDPQRATRVVESILNLFVERSLGDSRRDTSKTKQFIERQIAEYEARLLAAENRLKQFRQQNVGMLPGQTGGFYQRLESAVGQLEAAKLELREAEHRLAAVEGQVQGDEPTFGIGPPPVTPVAQREITSPYDGRIRELEASIDQLLMRYTERHPDIISSRSLLESLKEQQARYIQEAKAELARNPEVATHASAGGQDIVYQHMRLSVSQETANVAALRERVAEYERRVEELGERVGTVPRIEADLARLDRDYNINKANYDELVKRREALKLGEEASQTTDEVQFNILEPPRQPVSPNGPNRVFLSAGVFGVGVGGGLALALLLALVRPAVYTKEGFLEITDLPVLGVVSRVWTPREKLRRRMEVASFAVGCVGLLGMLGGLVALYQSGVDIAAKVQSLSLPLL
jgi:polysaccharide chain length determinant protein (PEP-CTERM system associated)